MVIAKHGYDRFNSRWYMIDAISPKYPRSYEEILPVRTDPGSQRWMFLLRLVTDAKRACNQNYSQTGSEQRIRLTVGLPVELAFSYFGEDHNVSPPLASTSECALNPAPGISENHCRISGTRDIKRCEFFRVGGRSEQE